MKWKGNEWEKKNLRCEQRLTSEAENVESLPHVVDSEGLLACNCKFHFAHYQLEKA